MNKRFAVAFIAIVAILLFLLVLEKFNVVSLVQNRSNTSQNEEISEEEKQAEAKVNLDEKKKFIEGDTMQTGPTPPAQSIDIQLSARTEGNNTVTIFTEVRGVSSGNCTLSISNGTKKMTSAADIIYQPEFSICGGFSIPVAELGSGAWDITLSVDSIGRNQTKNITYEVR